MLAITPDTPIGALGTVLSALIVVFSLAGLTIHSDFYAGICRRDYWAYYTNLSNLLVFVYFALAAPQLYARPALNSLIPHAEFAVMMSIMLTFFVFHFLLYPCVRCQAEHAPHTRRLDIVRADNAIEHYIVPLLTFAYWLLCSPGKAALQAIDALAWLGFPLAYLAFLFLRARLRGRIAGTDSAYPYPFLDADRLGVSRAVLNCAALFFLGLLSGLACVGLVHIAHSFPP